MRVNAIYFPDKNATHIKLSDTASCRDFVHHYIINGQAVYSDTYGSDDYILQGKIESIKAVKTKKEFSHYEHRETGAKVSVFEHDEYLKGLKNSDGEYKDLESEYLYRKYNSTYIPVYREVFEEEDCAIFFQEEHPCKVDEYCKCAGVLEKSDFYNHWQPTFFLYKFDKLKFCNDIVVKIMEEFGVPCLSQKTHPSASAEYYRLHDKDKYCWLELCGDEYFIKYEDMFRNHNDCIYGAYDDVVKAEKRVEDFIRNAVSSKLDNLRTTIVRKSAINKISEELEELKGMIAGQEKKRLIEEKLLSIRCQVNDIKSQKK